MKEVDLRCPKCGSLLSTEDNITYSCFSCRTNFNREHIFCEVCLTPNKKIVEGYVCPNTECSSHSEGRYCFQYDCPERYDCTKTTKVIHEKKFTYDSVSYWINFPKKCFIVKYESGKSKITKSELLKIYGLSKEYNLHFVDL